MKRDAWLVPFSHDHQHALACALRLHRAADGNDASQLELTTSTTMTFVDAELEPHMQREERELLPLLERNGWIEPSEAARLLAEHRELRLQAARLAARPIDASTARAFAELLHDHVRWEERTLFPLLQERSDDFHPTTR